LARYPRPQFIVFDNGGKFKREFKQMCSSTIMALKQNQLQVTTIYTQANAIIEQVHKVVNDMLRSFDLENNHENLEEQKDNLFDYFLQSTAWILSY
jgi:ABC-type phosphate transport system auxiliary subunit